MPLGQNQGKSTIDLRIRKLHIVSPDALKSTAVQVGVIDTNVDLKASQCGEGGFGSFNWLLRVDRTNGTLITGGAPPSTDPFQTGFCFYNHQIPSGATVQSATAMVTFTGDTFTSAKIPKLGVPIFNNGDVNDVILLPLSKVVMQKVTLSESDDCVGKLNLSALNASCQEDPTTCAKWDTAATLGGYITLEEADQVTVTILNESLCVVLTGDPGATAPAGSNVKKCKRTNGKIDLPPANQGDYCAATEQAGGCRDSFWLSATFAASAVNINNGAGVKECSP